MIGISYAHHRIDTVVGEAARVAFDNALTPRDRPVHFEMFVLSNNGVQEEGFATERECELSRVAKPGSVCIPGRGPVGNYR